MAIAWVRRKIEARLAVAHRRLLAGSERARKDPPRNASACESLKEFYNAGRWTRRVRKHAKTLKNLGSFLKILPFFGLSPPPRARRQILADDIQF